MVALTKQCEAARQKLLALVSSVCGSCDKSCCHHGTMMGSGDLPRLHKGLLLSEELRESFEQGLGQRVAELREDLRTLTLVLDCLGSRPDRDEPALSRLKAGLDAWSQFCDFALEQMAPDAQYLRKLLWFPGVRANAFRALRNVPGGLEHLAELAPGVRSLTFVGERMPPDRCLFHVDGCLAGDWKPVKCANFFCPTEPGLLGAIFDSLDFHEFVLANARSLDLEGLLALVSLELDLGAEYVAPKVILAQRTEVADALGHILSENGWSVALRSRVGQYMASSQEYRCLRPPGAEEAVVMSVDSIAPAALYEIGIAVERVASEGTAFPVYLVARQLAMGSPLRHPLWMDRALGQPVGALEVYALTA